MSNTKISKYICLLLRHHPEAGGITLDEHGWADIGELISAVSKKYTFDRGLLEEIVRTDAKQRYAISSDGTRIRANHGHTVRVDVEPEETVPPDVMYHGTARRNIPAIQAEGIRPMKRVYVHLSVDVETALSVGKRHGEPVVFIVDSRRMHEDGFSFFRSTNGLWLTNEVPPKYIGLMEESETCRNIS